METVSRPERDASHRPVTEEVWSRAKPEGEVGRGPEGTSPTPRTDKVDFLELNKRSGPQGGENVFSCVISLPPPYYFNHKATHAAQEVNPETPRAQHPRVDPQLCGDPPRAPSFRRACVDQGRCQMG